jgi:hypothetical protein
MIEMQETGIEAIGHLVSWGTHFCLFYEPKRIPLGNRRARPWKKCLSPTTGVRLSRRSI